MPNVSLGQRVGRGSVGGTRISVVVPNDVLPLLETLAKQNRSSLSLTLVELIERGLRDTKDNEPSKQSFLSQSELESLK
jgi:hypothetical protein